VLTSRGQETEPSCGSGPWSSMAQQQAPEFPSTSAALGRPGHRLRILAVALARALPTKRWVWAVDCSVLPPSFHGRGQSFFGGRGC